MLFDGTVQALGGSCRFGKGRICIGKPVKSMPELGTELVTEGQGARWCLNALCSKIPS
jgi:hypothetical protein